MGWAERIEHSGFPALVNWKEEHGKGRRCMLLSAFLSTVVNAVGNGALYTAFLSSHNFSLADASFLGAIPSFAACFCILSPVILERFPRRRWILAGARLAYYLLNFLCLTLLALYAKDPTARLIGFSVILLASNLINSLFSSGYTVWHINFMPVELRSKYLSFQQITTTVASFLSLYLFGFLADALKGTAYEATVLTALRFVALGFAVLDVVILSLPKEYPYLRDEKTIRLSHIIRLPLRHKKFLLTMLVIALWDFSMCFPSSAWNYYLLNDAGASITLLNFYYLFTTVCMITTPFWRKVLHGLSWFRTFAFCALIHAPSVFFIAFTRSGSLWIHPAAMLIQALVGVGLNLAWSNFPFINTPAADQTYYLSFYTLVAGVGMFLGHSAGAWFVRAFADLHFTLLGVPFGVAPAMMLIQSVLDAAIAVFILVFHNKLRPEVEH